MPKTIDLRMVEAILRELRAIVNKAPDQLRQEELLDQADKALEELCGMPSIAICFSPSGLNKLSLSISDLLCWHAGFAAARDGAYPLGVHELREFNIAIKRALED